MYFARCLAALMPFKIGLILVLGVELFIYGYTTVHFEIFLEFWVTREVKRLSAAEYARLFRDTVYPQNVSKAISVWHCSRVFYFWFQ
jgi:hypothetical protein